MKQSTTIRDFFIAQGWTSENAEELAMALKKYVENYGRAWRDNLTRDFMRAYYPCVNDRQSSLLQRARNGMETYMFVVELTAPKIKNESNYEK